MSKSQLITISFFLIIAILLGTAIYKLGNRCNRTVVLKNGESYKVKKADPSNGLLYIKTCEDNSMVVPINDVKVIEYDN